ncbi:anti-sigma factor family protein [Croceicoccus gelatinilyticus]|uniref:anti-sigma factor family protein n=1 Tax=Croceicoccus gelatinilyticus TaxID=2835536 RepID=UPI001BCFDB0F|nr:hypothetical protein [Croceicoccus gelatinilyticus]MBS7670157.1 hypothetical protein [Croceicoccus gelatinilyticus]
MTPTKEELAAFADGQIEGERQEEIAALVAGDPALAAEVARHHALRQKLAAHYAPILEQDLPEAMLAPLKAGEPGVVDMAMARQERAMKRKAPRWGWIAGPLAAAAALAIVFLPGGKDLPDGYAQGQLASALDTQLVSDGAADGTRVLLSFEDEAGRYCRAFSAGDTGGIACRDSTGWKLEADGDAGEAQATQYRQAGSDADLMARAQDMASGPALDSEGERAARERGWLAR